MTSQIHSAPSTPSCYRTTFTLLLAQQYCQGGKPSLFPSFSHCDCFLSPHQTLGTSQGRARVQGIRALGKKETDMARKMCKFLWIKYFHHRLYPSGNAGGAREKLTEARGAVQQGPDKDSAAASTEPRCCCRMEPISPWPPDMSHNPTVLCHPVWPLLMSSCCTVPWLQGIPITPTLGLVGQQHRLRLALTAVKNKHSPISPSSAGCSPPATPISAVFPLLAQTGAAVRWALSPNPKQSTLHSCSWGSL